MTTTLTRELILTASPEQLNEWVTVHVMEWKWVDEKVGMMVSPNTIGVQRAYAFDPVLGEPWFGWSPSTDISAAMEAVEHYTEANEVIFKLSKKDGNWTCYFFTNEWETTRIWGKPVPTIVCRALLLAATVNYNRFDVPEDWR